MSTQASLKSLAFRVLKETTLRRLVGQKCHTTLPQVGHPVGHLGTPPAQAAARLAAPPQLQKTIPAGAVLVAPRYDGMGRSLAAVPECWCCATPWKLEWLYEWKGKTYAYLEPGCGCLDVPQALACCGLCLEHCRCGESK